jgi:prophage antirepressor-like protein
MNGDVMKVGVYFKNHEYAGTLDSYDIFPVPNNNFGLVKATIINGMQYFCAIDICRGLCLDVDHTSSIVKDIEKEIMGLNKVDWNNSRFANFPYELYYYLQMPVTQMSNKGPVKQLVRTIFVSKDILLGMVFRSRKKEAVEFKWWVILEVLGNVMNPNSQYYMQSSAYTMIGELQQSVDMMSASVDNLKQNVYNVDTNVCMLYNGTNQLNMGMNILNNNIGAVNQNVCMTNANVLYGNNQNVNLINGLNTVCDTIADYNQTQNNKEQYNYQQQSEVNID